MPLQARLGAAEDAAASGRAAAAGATAQAAELRAALEAERRRAGTLEAERDGAAERLAVAQRAAAAERENMDASSRELQEWLWEAEDKVSSKPAGSFARVCGFISPGVHARQSPSRKT